MKSLFKPIAILLSLCVLPSINCSQANPNVEAAAVATKAATQPVPVVRLPELDPHMPDKPGLVAVQTLCNTCHTPHYIMNQPEFTKEVWTAEITKMQKVFNAPIPQEKVPEVLAYLMAVRGKESK